MVDDLNRADKESLPPNMVDGVSKGSESPSPAPSPAPEGEPPQQESTPAPAPEPESSAPEGNDLGGSPEQSKEGQEQPAKEESAGDGTPSEEKPATQPKEADLALLSEMTGGRIDSFDQLGQVLSHYEQLVEQINQPKAPEFPSAKAKAAYEYVMERPGDNAVADLKQFYHILELKPETMSPKDLQFEAFMLKEENSDLSVSQAKELFELDYADTYGEGEEVEERLNEDPRLKRKHDLATREAQKMIADVQTKAGESEMTTQQDAEKLQAHQNAIKQAVESGLPNIEFTMGDKGQYKFSALLDDPEAIKSIQQGMEDPASVVEEVLRHSMDNQGNYNYPLLLQNMVMMQYGGELMQIAFDEGRKAGLIDEAKEARQTETSGGKPTGTAPAQQPKPFETVFKEALEGSRSN